MARRSQAAFRMLAPSSMSTLTGPGSRRFIISPATQLTAPAQKRLWFYRAAASLERHPLAGLPAGAPFLPLTRMAPAIPHSTTSFLLRALPRRAHYLFQAIDYMERHRWAAPRVRA